MRKWLFMILLALAGPAVAAVVYGPAGQYQAAQQFITSRPGYWERLDKEIEKITGRQVYQAVRFMPCEAGETSYSRGVVQICYGLIDRFARVSKRFGESQRTLIAGAVMFAVLHESGHALIESSGRGSLAHENDADGLAAVMAKRIGARKNVMESVAHVSFSEPFLQKAIAYGAGSGKLRDEHPLHEQRKAAVICIMAGGDVGALNWAVSEKLLTPERAARCAGEAQEAEKALNALVR